MNPSHIQVSSQGLSCGVKSGSIVGGGGADQVLTKPTQNNAFKHFHFCCLL